MINFKDYIKSIFVPDKIKPNMLAFVNVVALELNNLQDNIFSTYKNLNSLPSWVAGTYQKGVLVKYGKSVFQSNEGNNTDVPITSNKWILITESFLGSDFRYKTRSERLVLEYAINSWFGTLFRQPPLRSEIYFTNNAINPINVFRVGKTESNSSNVSNLSSSAYVMNNYTFLDQFSLNLNVPLAFYNSLGTTNNIRESIIKSFVNQYITAGITYQIVTY